MKWIFFLLVFVSFFGACVSNKVPAKKYSQFQNTSFWEQKEDTLSVVLNNPLACPLRFYLFEKEGVVSPFFKENFVQVLKPMQDTIFKFYAPEPVALMFSYRIGDPEAEIRPSEIALPIAYNNNVKINQGYNGSFSHNKETSKYAIDFNLKVGDTVFSASDGIVVGVIESYSYGGNDIKWRPYANFITVFQPNSGLFYQYVHLKENGAFVKVGDSVKPHQPIALSGLTGFTAGPHLHFNVLKPVYSEAGLESVPIIFEGNIDGSSLKKGSYVLKK